MYVITLNIGHILAHTPFSLFPSGLSVLIFVSEIKRRILRLITLCKNCVTQDFWKGGGLSYLPRLCHDRWVRRKGCHGTAREERSLHGRTHWNTRLSNHTARRAQVNQSHNPTSTGQPITRPDEHKSTNHTARRSLVLSRCLRETKTLGL